MFAMSFVFLDYIRSLLVIDSDAKDKMFHHYLVLELLGFSCHGVMVVRCPPLVCRIVPLSSVIIVVVIVVSVTFSM